MHLRIITSSCFITGSIYPLGFFSNVSFDPLASLSSVQLLKVNWPLKRIPV